MPTSRPSGWQLCMSAPSRLVSRKLVCAPVTALTFLTPHILVVAQGPFLKLYDIRRAGIVLLVQKVLRTQRIHVLVKHEDSIEAQPCLLVTGGKEVALIDIDLASLSISTRCYWEANDWILAGAFLNGFRVLLATAHNSVQQYIADGHVSTLVQEISCMERPLLWSAAFTRSTYESPQDVLLAVGTIMNEILVWRPCFTGKSIERRLVGHTGSVFFVSFAPSTLEKSALRCLASGSDDRDVRIWRWRDDTESQVENAVLRGHTHRPWRAAWTSNGESLVTVGEDLRCLLWSTPQVMAVESWASKPSKHWKGHEGKNIWSVALSSDGMVTATGGSDGAVRLWPTIQEQHAKTLSATSDDPIASLHVGRRHVLAITRGGAVHHSLIGSPHLRLLYRFESEKRALQAVISLHEAATTDVKDDILYIATRTGKIVRLAIAIPTEATTKQHNLSPLAVSIHKIKGVQYLAVYDRRESRVVILSAQLEIVTQSSTLQTERKPRHLCWLNDTTLLLADSIASVWLYRFNSATIELIGEHRLDARGTVTMSASQEAGCFDVGNDDVCCTYRIVETGARTEIELVHTNYLNYGIVKQVLHTNCGRQYLCCTNTVAQVANNAGEVLATFSPPSSASSTLQVSRTQTAYEFYCTSSQGLHHYSHPLDPAPILQPGLHGREIWSVDLHQIGNGSMLCATTAEDNNIKISLVQQQGRNISVETLLRWPDVDGTLQNVCWSGCQADNEALLFVTAAKESMYALRIGLESEGRICATRAGRAKQPAREPIESEDSRIMALDALALGEGRHLLLAGHSDGSLRWWRYTEGSSSFELLGRTGWHDRCLLSLRLIRNRMHSKTVFAASGATDGRVAIWRLSVPGDGSQPTVDAQPVCSFEGVHQSGINCLDFVHDETDTFSLVSGGDDNAISYRRFRIIAGRPVILVDVRQSLAHSSSLKGIAFLSAKSFVSTSTDQRATVWSLLDKELCRTSSLVTQVADVSDLSVLRTVGSRNLAGVCGIGLEILEIE